MMLGFSYFPFRISSTANRTSEGGTPYVPMASGIWPEYSTAVTRRIRSAPTVISLGSGGHTMEQGRAVPAVHKMDAIAVKMGVFIKSVLVPLGRHILQTCSLAPSKSEVHAA